MERSSSLGKDGHKQFVQSIMLMRMRQQIIEDVCCEQSFLKYDLVLEMYEYFWSKLEQKFLKDSVFLKDFIEEFNMMMKNAPGKRIHETFYHSEKYPIIDNFLSLFFESSTLALVLNEHFKSESIASSKLIKIIDDTNSKQVIFGRKDIIDLNKDSRDVFIELVYNDMCAKFNEIFARNKQVKKNQKNVPAQEHLLKAAERKAVQEKSEMKKEAEQRFQFLCKKYAISKESQQAQQDAFVLMQSKMLAQEEQERKSVDISQQDRLKNLGCIMYEALYKKSMQDELQEFATYQQTVLQEALCQRHINLQKQLMLQFDFAGEELKCFGQLVLEPNAKSLEVARLKKEQRGSSFDLKTQKVSLGNATKINSQLDFGMSPNLELLKKMQGEKDVVRQARIQKRAIKNPSKNLSRDSANNSKDVALELLKTNIKNKNARYAIGIKDASCQTENEEVCLSSQNQRHMFSYDNWSQAAIAAQCPCISCCGLRKVFHDSDSGDIKAWQIEQSLRLHPGYAQSFYEDLSRKSKSFSSF